MPTLGLLLMPHKQRRGATRALLEELASAGVNCRPLPAGALGGGPAALAGVDAILHKLPADAGGGSMLHAARRAPAWPSAPPGNDASVHCAARACSPSPVFDRVNTVSP